MIKKILLFIVFTLSIQYIQAQEEFITLWKPYSQSSTPGTVDAPVQSANNEIWFPGIGENYTITWEEVNYPQHTGTISNVTSDKQVLINFGTSLNPIPADALYKVKVSNGSGSFKQIQFANNTAGWLFNGDANKVLEIQQWGNIKWQSMRSAFSYCGLLQLTASDSPDLSKATDVSYMFYNAREFIGNASMANWPTSKIKNFEYMFSGPIASPVSSTFNAPLGSWDTSSAENFSYMFYGKKFFNQNLNSWNTSKVTDMSYMFSFTRDFNQPLSNWNTSQVTNMSSMFYMNKNFNQNLDSWNTSNVTDISYMFAETENFNQPLNSWDTSQVINMTFLFHYNMNFNQPLNNWDTSSATDISHIFHGCTAFNQPLDLWDTSKVTTITLMFSGATRFNQSLETWNLPLLTTADSVFTNSGLDCNNYSKTIVGWANNPNTASNINLGSLASLSYSSDIIDQREVLINKGWIFSNDVPGECRFLAVSEAGSKESGSIYPNPVHHIIFIRNMADIQSYVIMDATGRISGKGLVTDGTVNVESLAPGNYFLQLISKEKIHPFKFIKK